MATYRKRSGGWRAEVCKKGIRESATYPTKAEATAWATQREAEILAGVSSKGGSSSTLKEALEKYKKEVTPTKAGRRWEEIRIEKFIREIPFVGEKISDVGEEVVAEWRDARLKEVDSPSVRREMGLLSAVFEQAKREWRWIARNPLREVKRPPNNRHRDRRISPAEEQTLLDEMGYIEGQPPQTKTQELAYAFLLAIETAMRQGEILGLTKDRVHLDKRYVALDSTKNGDARSVPLSRRAVDLLRILVDAAKGEEVFTVSSKSADMLFRKARDRTDIVDLRFHDTRHEATTRLARKLDVLDLARMTGHRDPRYLMVYYNATATEVASRLD